MLLNFVLPMIVAIVTGVASAFISVRVALAVHHQRINAVEEAIKLVRSMASTANRRIDEVLNRLAGDRS